MSIMDEHYYNVGTKLTKLVIIINSYVASEKRMRNFLNDLYFF